MSYDAWRTAEPPAPSLREEQLWDDYADKTYYNADDGSTYELREIEIVAGGDEDGPYDEIVLIMEDISARDGGGRRITHAFTPFQVDAFEEVAA
jgi:hypothetical protein